MRAHRQPTRAPRQLPAPTGQQGLCSHVTPALLLLSRAAGGNKDLPVTRVDVFSTEARFLEDDSARRAAFLTQHNKNYEKKNLKKKIHKQSKDLECRELK